jgi:transposase
MPGPPAPSIELSHDARKELTRLARGFSIPAAVARRARAVLLAADGLSTGEIGRRLGMTAKTVRLWRARFHADPQPRSLGDRPRSGRPPSVPPEVRAKLVSLACERPTDDKTPFRLLWTRASLRTALHGATGVWLSESEIGRILNAAELRPHLVRLWLHCQDPEFDVKVKRICDLYCGPPAGTTVLCIDEKRLFAHCRPHPLQPAAPGTPAKREFEYSRHGSSVLLAAFDIRTGRLFADCRPRRTGDDLVEFMEMVAAAFPGKVVVIWDNLNVHYDGKDKRWTRFNERHGGRFEFVYTPKHASWTNQVEIWFSLLHRRVLKHGSFPSVEAVTSRVIGFVAHWNEHEAHPFNWTFRGRAKSHQRGFDRLDACPTDRRLGRKRPAAAAA